jgi:hypothetical protein
MGCQRGGGPGGLQVVSSAVPVDIQYFAKKYNSLTKRDSMVLEFTSARGTPPQVTMATWKSPNASISRGKAVVKRKSAKRFSLLNSATEPPGFTSANAMI